MLENGYMRIATELAEQFCKYRFSGEEWQVLWVIIRKTYGWGKKSDRISYGQISSYTNISRRGVIRAVGKLVERGSVKKDTTIPITLSLITDYKKWKVVSKKTPSVKIVTEVVSKKRTQVVSKKRPTIDKKETIQKIERIFNYFLVKTKKKYTLSRERKEIIKKALKTYSDSQIQTAIDRFVEDDWEGRANHMDLVYCLGKRRGIDNIEKWLNKPVGNNKSGRYYVR